MMKNRESKWLYWEEILTVIFFLILTLLYAQQVKAQEVTPAGTWTVVYDGQDRVVYKLWVHNDTLFGKVTKMDISSSADKNPVCASCKGANKDKPITGMTIISGLKKDEKGEWTGGTVLDPDTGKYHKCKIVLKENGSKLELKGYAGIFSATETWSRVN